MCWMQNSVEAEGRRLLRVLFVRRRVMSVDSRSAGERSTDVIAADRMSPVDGLCGKTRKMTGRENLDFARQTSSARVIVTMRLMGGPHGATSPARPNPW